MTNRKIIRVHVVRDFGEDGVDEDVFEGDYLCRMSDERDLYVLSVVPGNDPDVFARRTVAVYRDRVWLAFRYDYADEK